MVSELSSLSDRNPMANLTAEQYDTLQEMLKVITEARQISERLSESWAKGLANPIGPRTTHLSSPITPMTPSQSPQPPDPLDLLLVDPEAAKMVDTRTQSLIDVNKQLAETHTTQLEQLQKHSEESAAWRAEIDERFMDIKNVRADPLPRESSVTLISYPTPTKPPDPPDIRKSRQDLTIKAPDPPDFNQSELISAIQIPNKLSLRYSCEEIHERMTNGLCIFCEELDTPEHYNLKHKRSKICLVECVADGLPDVELVEPAVEEISKKSQIFMVKCDSNESSDVEKPGEVIVEEIANKPVDMIQEKESNPENDSRPEFSHQVLLSQVQHTPTNQYRAPFNPCQNHSDKPHNKSKFGNCIGHETEFDRESDEIEDDELQDKQIEQTVETLVMNEGEQPLDTTRYNNLFNQMAASLGLVGGDDQEDDTKLARKGIVKKNNSETKIESSSSDHSCFVALITTSNLHKDTMSLPKDFTTSNGVKRECREIVLTDKGNRAWALELRFNQVGNGEILVMCPAEKASKKSFPLEVMHWINQKNEAGYFPNEKIVYILTSGLCQAKRDHEGIRVLEKLIPLDLLDCSSLTGLFCKPKLEVEVTVLLEGNMNIKRTTFFGRNVVKWKCWLVMGSRLPLHYWVTWRKLIVWEVLCILQNNTHRLLLVLHELQKGKLCFWRLKMVLLLGFLWLILFTSKMFKSSNVHQNKNQIDQKLSSYWKLLLRLLHPLHINRRRSFYLLVIKSLFKGKEETVSSNIAVTSCSRFGFFPYSTWMVNQNRHASSSCALRQEENYVLVLFTIAEALTFFNDQHTLVAENNGTETSIVLKQNFGRATHQLQLKMSLFQVLLHIQNRDCRFFDYMLVVTSDCFGTLLEIPNKEIAKPDRIFFLTVLKQWKWYPPTQAIRSFAKLSMTSNQILYP